MMVMVMVGYLKFQQLIGKFHWLSYQLSQLAFELNPSSISISISISSGSIIVSS